MMKKMTTAVGQRSSIRLVVMVMAVAVLSPFLFLSGGVVSAQQQEELEICACSPRVYEFTFDFQRGCQPLAVDFDNGGLLDVTCLTTGFDNLDVIDLVPVAASSVQIVEIGQDGSPAAVAQETGNFENGSTLTYTSTSFDNSADPPRAIQLRILGRNAAGEPIVNQFAITFSNDCNVFPVLYINDSVGWIVFTDLSLPLESDCPMVAAIPPGNDTDVATYPVRTDNYTYPEVVVAAQDDDNDNQEEEEDTTLLTADTNGEYADDDSDIAATSSNGGEYPKEESSSSKTDNNHQKFRIVSMLLLVAVVGLG